MSSPAPLPAIAFPAWRSSLLLVRDCSGVCVHEKRSRYDDGGSEHRALGSISVHGDAWWSVSLAVQSGQRPAGEFARLRLTRHGAMSFLSAGVNEEQELVLPIAELDAIVTLLGGVVQQARRHGVIAAPGGVPER